MNVKGTMESTYAKLIRKMQHGKYRPENLAQFDVVSVPLFVLALVFIKKLNQKKNVNF